MRQYKLGFFKKLTLSTITEKKRDICDWVLECINISGGKWIVKENLVFLYDEFDGILCFANEKKYKFENKSLNDMMRIVDSINRVLGGY